MRITILRKAVEEYLARGWAPVPIPPKSKAPNLPGWQNLKIKPEEIPKRFQRDSNVGLILGEKGGNLIDVDLDAHEALAVARTLLPPTGRVHGRRGKPFSHFWYTSEITPPYEKFSDIDGTCLVEIRSTGHQTIVPPSVHPSGEKLEWHSEGEPARIDATELRTAVVRTAACAMVARHWPAQGQRNDAALALAGFLLRAEWSEDEAATFIIEAARAAGDEECDQRGKTVVGTAKTLSKDDPATGIPTLREILGDSVVTRLQDWLGVAPQPCLILAENPAPKRPRPMSEAAFYGPAGDIVRAIEPHSEADPVAILIQLLAAFGNLVGRHRYFRVGAKEHFTNIFAVLVGDTAKSRKGTAWAFVAMILRLVEGGWVQDHVATGLSSGEGLIHVVRDPVERREPVKRGGRVIDYQTVIADHGVEDKRILALEEEFSSPLVVMRREGNILSPIIRQAWDTGNLRQIIRNNPEKSTGAHISIVGHITDFELRRHLDTTEMANGFANRFLWIAVRRSKFLPEGGNFSSVNVTPLVKPLKKAVEFAKEAGELTRDSEARELWIESYENLSRGRLGLVGGMISRSEAQVLRLSCIYALLDCSSEIRLEHLSAALAVWEYAEETVYGIFGDSLGDPLADAIIRHLRSRQPNGMTRTEIRGVVGRNVHANQIERALKVLQDAGYAHHTREKTDGRPVERWFATERFKRKKT